MLRRGWSGRHDGITHRGSRPLPKRIQAFAATFQQLLIPGTVMYSFLCPGWAGGTCSPRTAVRGPSVEVPAQAASQRTVERPDAVSKLSKTAVLAVQKCTWHAVRHARCNTLSCRFGQLAYTVMLLRRACLPSARPVPSIFSSCSSIWAPCHFPN